MCFSAQHLRKELDKLADLAGGEKGQRGKGEKGHREASRVAVPTDASCLPLFPSAPAPPFSSAPLPVFRDLIIAGPAPAPLARAESNYRYQIMLRTRQMSKLSRCLGTLNDALALPDDVSLTIDIDPVNLI